MGVVEQLLRARQTYERGDWVAAFQTWSDVDPQSLDADDQTRLAYAAYLLGRREDCVAALQRAFRTQVDAGEPAAAAHSAIWLAMVHSRSGEPSVAGGWAARAQALLAEAGEVVERGYLTYLRMHRHIGASEWAEAFACAVEAAEVGRRFGDADLTALGLSAQGRLTLQGGSVPAGLALFDEAMTGVASGEVSAVWAGDIYCLMIEGCQEVCDFGRAAEWTEALGRWCDAQPGLVMFTGQCAVHRGQIMAMRGAWAEALEEFGLALDRYVIADATEACGFALAERGDLFRLRGEYAAADAAYAEAGAYGFEPQPGLAMLWLAQGRREAAHAAMTRLLAETAGAPRRSRLLPAAVQVLAAVGDVARAGECAAELTAIAQSFGCAAVTAESQDAAGLVALAQDDAAGALPHLRQALRGWAQLGCPFRTARSQGMLGRGLLELGDPDSAARELRAALTTLTGLGAGPEAAELRRLLAPSRLPAGLTDREAEVLRLLASGRSNAQIAAELVLSHKTVARHLSNIYTKLDVTTRTAAAAYAFEHELA
jgi:DNA-binding CsgD family transcriptional regulator